LVMRDNPPLPLHDSVTGRAVGKPHRSGGARAVPAKRINFVGDPQIPAKRR
jgi:hypothetical protein